MCERNDTPGNDGSSNLHFARFKQKLIENDFKSQCRKCSSPGYVLLQKQDVYCAGCLQDYCIQKFRSTIGKSRLVKSGDKVMVCVSGGTGSIAMLDMIRFCTQLEDEHKRIRYVPSILHIYEGILNDYEPLREELFKHLITNSNDNDNFDCYITTMEQLLNPSGIEFIQIKPNQQNIPLEDSYNLVKEFCDKSMQDFGTKFKEIFDCLKSLSSKEDFTSKLQLLIITRLSSMLGFEKVFVGSTMSELSIDLINHMALGKGMEIHSQTNFHDDRFEPVQLLRPMREFSNKEMIFYSKHRNLQNRIYKTNLSTTTNRPIHSSIFKMTEHFLNNLQNEFPATLHTIFHTGSKLKSSDEQSKQKCLFCYSKLDLNSDDNYSAYDALRLTAALSIGDNIGLDDNRSTLPAITTTDCGGVSPTVNQFCYSCQRLASELGIDRLSLLTSTSNYMI